MTFVKGNRVRYIDNGLIVGSAGTIMEIEGTHVRVAWDDECQSATEFWTDMAHLQNLLTIHEPCVCSNPYCQA